MEQKKVHVQLNRKEIKELAKRCHFSDKDISCLEVMQAAVQPLLKPELYFELISHEQLVKIFGKEGTEQPSKTQYILSGITIGEGLDLLQELYEKKEAMTEAYILDCLGMELVEKARKELLAMVSEQYGWNVSKLHFPGAEDEYPIEMIARLLEYLKKCGNCEIQYNERYIMYPKKSILFVAELTKENCSSKICENCSAENCTNRKEKVKSREENLSYGYQRIFGTRKQEEME